MHRLAAIRVRTLPAAILAAIAAVLPALLLAMAAPPAHALIEQVKAGAETNEVGVQWRNWPKGAAEPEVRPLQYHEGAIDPASSTYAIYWDPLGSYHSDWMRLIDGYLHDVGAASGQLGNVFALSGQYTGPASTRAAYQSTFRGAYTDQFAYPATNACKQAKTQPTCITDAQIRAELKRFIAAEGLPTGKEIVYFVLTPPSVTVCLDEEGKGNCSTSDKEIEEEATPEKKENMPGPVENTTGFCSYHSAIEPTSEHPIVYGVQPWTAGHAGHVINEFPLETIEPTGAELACQNGLVLIEPNQATSFIHFDSYETGLADLIVNDLSQEQSDIVPNPLLSGGWFQTTTKSEQSDMCRYVFSPPKEQLKKEKLEGTQALGTGNETVNGKSYYLQYAYSSVGVTSGQTSVCWSGVELEPHFTATNVVGKETTLAFDAFESGITLDANVRELKLDEPYTVPVYKWEFGDGATMGPSINAASVFHSYQYGGNYPVTLTVTDSGGSTAKFMQIVPVSGPPAPSGASTSPSSPAPAAPSGSTATSTPSTAGTGSSTPAAATAAPTVVESPMSRSLKKVASLGLALRYTVNEQVAGRVEAILDAATAKRLHIRARTAFGLPQGYPKSVVVGQAVLVTTMGGHGVVRLRFSKAIAKRLAHAGRVTLTLRFVVRNASRTNPQTTTTLSKIVLSH